MRLYLDDDSALALLTRLLRQAGHDVRVPAEIGMAGDDDPVHLAQAIREDRALLTHNHHDFEDLHNLLMVGAGHHRGILGCGETTIQNAISTKEVLCEPSAIYWRREFRSTTTSTS
jgi:predicted nuclease of predicted toxin-antitoxin system